MTSTNNRHYKRKFSDARYVNLYETGIGNYVYTDIDDARSRRFDNRLWSQMGRHVAIIKLNVGDISNIKISAETVE